MTGVMGFVDVTVVGGVLDTINVKEGNLAAALKAASVRCVADSACKAITCTGDFCQLMDGTTLRDEEGTITVPAVDKGISSGDAKYPSLQYYGKKVNTKSTLFDVPQSCY